jgi:hypothetical protein
MPPGVLDHTVAHAAHQRASFTFRPDGSGPAMTARAVRAAHKAAKVQEEESALRYESAASAYQADSKIDPGTGPDPLPNCHEDAAEQLKTGERTEPDIENDLRAGAAKLTSHAPSDAVKSLLERLAAALLDSTAKRRVLAGIKKTTKVPIGDLRSELAPLERRAQRDARRQKRARQGDRRPEHPAPSASQEVLPQMAILNDVLGRCSDPEPPMRDVDWHMTAVHVRRPAGLHMLTVRGTNADDETRLPAPDQPLLSRLTKDEVSELIERHVAYVDELGGLVHLPGIFVEHYLCRRNDTALPAVRAVSTLPLVKPDGTLLGVHCGLDRSTGFVFRVPPLLLSLLPGPDQCDEIAIATAMRFLTEEWLCDVTTSHAGKCVIIACALSIIERLILSDRPAFVFTAAQRGGGKTTLLNMISMAVLGARAAAGAWSPSDEERRKPLFAYLLEGVPFLVWDNLRRGTAVACPSIEKALTTETYSDRILGISKALQVSSTTIMAFTGNNIGAAGDMLSRTLEVKIEVTRPDPENRPFAHPDPIGWTEAHRGRILQALYTVLLGNPRWSARGLDGAETRFKLWWHVVGAAVEHAAALYAKGEDVSFRDLFQEREANAEDVLGLAGMLTIIRARWPNGCTSKQIVAEIGGVRLRGVGDALYTAIEQATGKRLRDANPRTVTWMLKPLIDTPAKLDDGTYSLRFDPNKDAGLFFVDRVSGGNPGKGGNL